MDDLRTLHATPRKSRSDSLIVRLGFIVEIVVKVNVVAAVLVLAWRAFST